MTRQKPIELNETLAVGSTEGFLTAAETASLAHIMDRFLLGDDGIDARATYGHRRVHSIHEIPGHDTAVAMTTYEPAGRVEITEIPVDAEAMLQRAFRRARPMLARILPSVTSCRPWTYVEYAVGQHITAHLDGIAPDPAAWPRQIAGISVTIEASEEGGDFFVETTSSQRLWNSELTGPVPGYAAAMSFAHDGADNSSPWFATMPRTRWTVSPGPGTALLYGSQLAHGTTPVRSGHSRKFISWLFAEQLGDGRMQGFR